MLCTNGLLGLPALAADRPHFAAQRACFNGGLAGLRRCRAGWREGKEAASGDEEGTDKAGYFLLDVAHGFAGNKVMW